MRITEERLCNIIREAIEAAMLNSVEYLYHATPSCYVNSIRKYGLGGKIPEMRLWDYEGTPYKNITKGCFLATDEYVAESYVEASDSFDELCDVYGEDLDIVVFRVAVKDLDLNLLSIDENLQVDEDHTYFYNGVIPFNKLEVVEL